jgi:hypothetical protein
MSVSSTSLTFPTTVVGEFAYLTITIYNNGDADEYLYTATASGDFFPTFGGTCNTSIGPTGRNYYIPAGTSCTFQWGFHPSHPGKHIGTGILDFDISPSISISLTGRATRP